MKLVLRPPSELAGAENLTSSPSKVGLVESFSGAVGDMVDASAGSWTSEEHSERGRRAREDDDDAAAPSRSPPLCTSLTLDSSTGCSCDCSHGLTLGSPQAQARQQSPTRLDLVPASSSNTLISSAASRLAARSVPSAAAPTHSRANSAPTTAPPPATAVPYSHPDLPSSLEVRTLPGRGRGIVARAAFRPGHTLLATAPLVSALDNLHYSTRCASCYRAADGLDSSNPAAGAKRNLLQCSLCHVVQYCTPACQKRDWPVHKLECAALRAAAKATKGTKTVPDTPVRALGRLLWTSEVKGKELVRPFPTPRDQPLVVRRLTCSRAPPAVGPSRVSRVSCVPPLLHRRSCVHRANPAASCRSRASLARGARALLPPLERARPVRRPRDAQAGVPRRRRRHRPVLSSASSRSLRLSPLWPAH